METVFHMAHKYDCGDLYKAAEDHLKIVDLNEWTMIGQACGQADTDPRICGPHGCGALPPPGHPARSCNN